MRILPVRAAIYARVSTTDQSPEMQLEELRTYAERRGFEIAGEYVDNGVSGSKDRRPALDRLMRDAHRRQLDSLLVWKLDRFGRSLRHLVNALAELEARGVAFVSLRDNLDLSTPAGRLMFQIIAAMAEFERSLTVERVKAGMASARKRGKHVGRPAMPVDPALVLGLLREGLSRRAIAKRLGVSEAKVRRVLAGCDERVSENGAAEPSESGAILLVT
jgi:DNA invertase Pin-like site-specific DNA recombinase